MPLGRLARTTAAAACFFFSGAESAECAGTQMDVYSTADAQTLVEALRCTGGGEFYVTWHGTVETTETFDVAEGVSLTVAAAKSSNLTLEGDARTATIVGDRIAPKTGIFSVSGASTLTLDNLVLLRGGSTAEYGAGAVAVQRSTIGNKTLNVINCLFKNNFGTDAGAIFADENSVVNIYGTTDFIGNNGTFSGAIFADENSVVNIYGTTDFIGNNGTFSGAVSVYNGTINIGGNTTFTDNVSFYLGGAIYAYKADLTIEDVVFTNNSATFDGGAIYAGETTVNITGSSKFTNNTASRSGGGVYSIESNAVSISGNVSFVGNSASVEGGAVAVTSPGELNIRDATFVRNKAISGGAVSVVSTAIKVKGSNHLLRSCSFQGNIATDGGALYLFNSARTVNVTDSVFRENTAVSSGGAIHHTGDLNVADTRYVANQAGGRGMAVNSLGYLLCEGISSFESNARYCPSNKYGYDEDLKIVGEDDTRRADAVCTGCLEAYGDEIANCLSFLSNKKNTMPAAECKDKPTGVVVSSTGTTSTGTTVATLELTKGYYRTSGESHDVLECYRTKSCIGGLNASNYCASGYEGPYCAVCSEGLVSDSRYMCHECSGKRLRSAIGLGLLTLMVFVVVLVLVLSHLLAVLKMDGSAEDDQEAARGFRKCKPSSRLNVMSKMFPLTSIKIVVVVWQILTQFAGVAGGVYPDEYEAFLSKVILSNVDIGSFLSFSCVREVNFFHRLLLTTIMPLVVFAALFATYTIAKKRNETSETAIRAVKNKHRSAALFVTFLVYSPVSTTVFKTFGCDPLDNGLSYLRADYSLTCGSVRHRGFKAYAIVMVLVYPLGIPVAFTWWLARHRHDLTKPGREAVAQLQACSSLWAAYRPEHFYYEVVECIRRVAISAGTVFVLPDSAAQIAVVLLIAVVFSFVSESLQPFQDNIDMWLYRWGNGVLLVSMYVALLRKVKVSGEDTTSQKTFGVVFIAANVLMVIAVFVQAALIIMKLHMQKKPVEVHPSIPSVQNSSETGKPNVRDAQEAKQDDA